MSHEQNGNHGESNGAPKRFIPTRSTDERGRLLTVTDEQRRSLIEDGNRALDELAEMTDETDTPELWDEVLRNLGVDPATGRPIGTTIPSRTPRNGVMTMPATNALHVTPEGEAWAVKLDESAAPSSVHPTRWLAVATAFEMLEDRDEAEVVVHHEDGRVRSSLTIRQVEADDGDDPAARAEALRLAPSNARLKAGIARRLPIDGADLEADPAELFVDPARFASLVARWKADCEFLSSPPAMAKHPAYREIVAMGKPAVPLILAELEARPDFWFAALREITGEDPVPPEARGKVKAMAGAWLEWGHSHGVVA